MRFMDDDTALRDYLAQAETHPSLTWAEERDLSEVVQRGIAAQQRLADSGAEPTERPDLHSEILAGQAAHRRFVEANLLLVVTIAKRQFGSSSLDLLDLIQDGNFGLMEAVDRWDPARGKWSVFAGHRIRYRIQEGILRTGRTVRVGERTERAARQIANARDTLTSTGAQVTVSSLAESTGLTPAKVTEVLSAERFVLPLESISEDAHVDDMHDTIERQEAVKAIHERVAMLGEVEALVLVMHFGLDGSEPLSVIEIAERLGMTRGRINKIRARALDRMEHPCNGRHLRSFLFDDVESAA